MKKRLFFEIIAIVMLLLFLVPFSYAQDDNIDITKPWFPLRFLAACKVNECSSVSQMADSTESGNIDKADSITAHNTGSGAEIPVDSGFWHPLSQIAVSDNNLKSIDADNNGWPDVCDSLTSSDDSGYSPIPVGKMFEPMYIIGKSFQSMNTIDANNTGWPDQCDCVLSELHHDKFNCGECGNVCGADEICIDSSCYSFSWNEEDEWSDCSEECGGGIQTKEIFCERDDGVNMGSDCDVYPGCECAEKPEDSQECNSHSCCTPETNAQFCTRLAKECGFFTGYDNCGTSRTVNCGGCTSPLTCEGGGINNACGFLRTCECEYNLPYPDQKLKSTFDLKYESGDYYTKITKCERTGSPSSYELNCNTAWSKTPSSCLGGTKYAHNTPYCTVQHTTISGLITLVGQISELQTLQSPYTSNRHCKCTNNINNNPTTQKWIEYI